MTGTDFLFVTIIAKPLLAHVRLQRTPLRSQHIFSNVLEASWCPFQKGLWLAAYPLPNSLDDGVVVRKPHALQVWFDPSEQVEITWGQIGTVRRMCQKFPFQFPEGFHCCFGRMGACIVLKEGYPLSTVFRLDRNFSFTSVARRSE